jgi:hypothetical protein
LWAAFEREPRNFVINGFDHPLDGKGFVLEPDEQCLPLAPSGLLR